MIRHPFIVTRELYNGRHYYVFRCPDLPGVVADGDTPHEAILAGEDWYEEYLEDMVAAGVRPKRYVSTSCPETCGSGINRIL
jgi:predicted RNase H-like HicB family nuclease